MSNVIDIASRKPTGDGPCVCLACGHEWHGVVPVGVTVLTCPKCKADKGILSGFYRPQTYWCCSKCSGWIFTIGENETMCATCGQEVVMS